MLTDSTCAGISAPFLPGTAPRVLCESATPWYGVGMDSLSSSDSLMLPPDTSNVAPEPLEAAPPAEEDTTYREPDSAAWGDSIPR